MDSPQTRDVCWKGTIHLQTILCSLLLSLLILKPFYWLRIMNHEFWQSSITEPLICKMLRKNGQSKSLFPKWTFSFIWPLVFSAFFCPIYILIAHSCLHRLVLWPGLKYRPWAPLLGTTICRWEDWIQLKSKAVNFGSEEIKNRGLAMSQ